MVVGMLRATWDDTRKNRSAHMTSNTTNNTAIIFLILLVYRIRDIMISRAIREHEKVQQWELMQ